MSKPEVLEKTPMNVVEVKAALDKIKKAAPEEELNFRAAKTDEYAQDFAKLKPTKAKELVKKLLELEIPRFRDVHAHKLVDIMPTSEKQLKMILTAYHMTITGENIKKLLSTLAEYSK